jgi:hypothetical protein
MALPLHVLERLPPQLTRNGGISLGNPLRPGLVLGIAELDQVLPDGGLLRGGVVELGVCGGAALATSIALAACRSAQEEGRRRGVETPWCAFVDPSRSLYAPGVVEAGVVLDRLLVVRPPLEAFSRVALRVVESQAFAAVVIDTAGVPGSSLSTPLGSWPRIVRRLAMAVEGTEACVLLITDASMPRALPLPVAQRIELVRPGPEALRVRVAKDKYGRVSSPRTLRWVRPGLRPLAKSEPVATLEAASRAHGPA